MPDAFSPSHSSIIASRVLFSLLMAVVFAMAVSYFLSRTLVPTLVRYLLASEAHRGSSRQSSFHAAFERGFECLRTSYGQLLERALAHPRTVIPGFLGFVALSVALFPLVGRDFFRPRACGPRTRARQLEAL
jgi:multidrug efflux pump subunit AcrB